MAEKLKQPVTVKFRKGFDDAHINAPEFAKRMEAAGAALATTLSRVIQAALCLACARQEGYIRPDWKHFAQSSKALSRDFRAQCLPLMGGSLLWGVGFTSYTAVIGHMGTDAAAANSVAAVIFGSMEPALKKPCLL